MISVNLFSDNQPSVTEMKGSNRELELELAEALFTYMYLDSSHLKGESILDLASEYHDFMQQGASIEDADEVMEKIARMITDYISDISSTLLYLISDKQYIESRKEPDAVMNYCIADDLVDFLKDIAMEDKKKEE